MLKKINEADLFTIDDFGLRTQTAQEQSLVYEIIKSRANNLSTIIVSQRPCADWYEWLGGKYVAVGVADRIVNFYYLIELKGESPRALTRIQAKEATGPKARWSLKLRCKSGRPNLKNQNLFRGTENLVLRISNILAEALPPTEPLKEGEGILWDKNWS